jgi:dUTP pyrophosphatase
MKIYKDNKDAEMPEFATEGSAAFDVKACLTDGDKIRAFNPHNKEMLLPVRRASNGKMTIQVQPQFRTLIPTGLILDIPSKHVVKLHIRSSMSLKYGLMLANGVAVIDSDYVDPLYIMLYNMCDTPINLYHGDRVAQGILEKTLTYTLSERVTKPEQKTDRDGGLGSTGGFTDGVSGPVGTI